MFKFKPVAYGKITDDLIRHLTITSWIVYGIVIVLLLWLLLS